MKQKSGLIRSRRFIVRVKFAGEPWHKLEECHSQQDAECLVSDHRMSKHYPEGTSFDWVEVD